MPDYSAFQSLEYLDMVAMETLRKYSPASSLSRGCVQDYAFPGLESVPVRKGDSIFINVVGIHHDPRHYPDPDKFDPERFSKENKAKRNP